MVEEIGISSSARIDAIDITSKIQNIVKKSNVGEGTCKIFVPHTTAGITINEHADPSVIEDILMESGKLVPMEDNYAHTEGNSAAHIKSSIIGHTLEVFIEKSALKLGTWQGIFFCEFDGPRKRKIWVRVSK